MEVNKLVFGGIALGCLTAAAAGGYLAGRPSGIEPPLSAPAVAAEANEAQPVTESEGVISPSPDATPAPEASPAPEPRPTPGRESAPAPTTRPAPAPRATSAPAARSARAEPRPSPRRTPAPVSERREEPPATESTVASAPAPAPASVGGMWETRPTVAPERIPAVESEPEPPPAPEFVEVVVPADSVLGLRIERTISSETARVEDRVEARVTRDVRVGDRVAIPAGSTVQGSVMEVERGGKIRERARLGVRFHSVVLADGTRLNIKSDAVIREGDSPAKESAAKIGGAAVGGAILGAILGGGKGAVIGGATGAAGGTAASMAGDRNPAILSAGSTVSVRVLQPVAVKVEP